MASIEEPYNALTLALFSNRTHAAQGGEDAAYRAQVAESNDGARLELLVRVAGDQLSACRYRVFGCPHLVAAAEWWCDQSEGKPVSDLAAFDPQACTAALGIPVEKTGRVLLLEDAIRSLADQAAAG